MSFWKKISDWFKGTDGVEAETTITEQEWKDGQLTQEELEAGQLTDEELEKEIHNSHSDIPFENDPLHEERDIRDSTNEWMFESESQEEIERDDIELEF